MRASLCLGVMLQCECLKAAVLLRIAAVLAFTEATLRSCLKGRMPTPKRSPVTLATTPKGWDLKKHCVKLKVEGI